MYQQDSMTRREKLITDENEIKSILDTAKIIHVAMSDNNIPYLVPMNYGYVMNEGRISFYLHGAPKGKKLDILRENPRVFISLECDTELFEGDIACRYGMSYRSLLGGGVAHFVDDPEEKKNALSALMKAQTGSDFEFSDRMAAVVCVIRIDLDEYTAKYRPAPTKKA